MQVTGTATELTKHRPYTAFTSFRASFLVRDMLHDSREKIHVLFMDHTAQLGGGEIALRNLLKNLDASLIQASVLLCAEGPLADLLGRDHPVDVLPVSTAIRDTRKELIGWRSLLKAKELLSGLAYTLRVSRYIRKLKPHIIHTNSLKADLIGGVAGRLAGVPVIWHVRDRIAADYLPPSAVRLFLYLSKVVPRFLIANSQATLHTLVEPTEDGKKVQTDRYRVIHDGCELLPEQSMFHRNGPIKVGLIGRISPWKGQHIFIQAAAMIRDEFPDVCFQIIGAPLFSETKYEAEVKQLARDLQVDKQIEFVGFVHDVKSVLEKLHVVVHASTVGEPFGQVVIEGMAAGKPVIATDGGGIPEIVVDGVSGLLVKMNDAHGLAEAMRVLLRNPKEAQQMGARGRERVRDCFTIERTARAVEQVYREVLFATAAGAKQINSIGSNVQIRSSEES